MRHATSFALSALLAAAAAIPGTASAQSASALLEEAHKRQQKFEELRASRIPVDRVSGARQTCDEQIGRICIWFGGDDESRIPAEFDEVREARRQLIGFLLSVQKQAPDRWTTGQLVNYLIEDRNVAEALRVATDCGIPEGWWCAALRGYVLHKNTQYVESEDAFREALSLMPADERERWTTPRYILTGDGRERFENASPEERDRMWELLWRLSDPLFLVRGNDRMTDHYARLVFTEFERDAANPMGMPWREDLEETLIRYGLNTGYSRMMDPAATFNLRMDTRQVVGHHHPKSRGYLFPEEFLESPAEVPPESWITAPRKARTWYAPPYAPEMQALETQVARFRRGDQMLVVGAYQPAAPEPDPEPTRQPRVRLGPRNRDQRDADSTRVELPPIPLVPGQAHAAFFLMPLDGTEPQFVRSEDIEGVMTITAAPGQYVSGLELVDQTNRRAWRARQGVIQRPLEEGGLDVSDLLILKEGVPLPATLQDAIPDARPNVRIRRGERFPIVWEAYGLAVDKPVQVTLGFTRGRPGFLKRVGEFLGVISPDEPVVVTFADPAPGQVQTAFRAIELALPELDPGEYTLHLRLAIEGREPVTTSRPITVE